MEVKEVPIGPFYLYDYFRTPVLNEAGESAGYRATIHSGTKAHTLHGASK